MNEKHANFRRLSEKRLETITDAIRIWSNLSGPSYVWTVEEVLDQAKMITEAVDMGLARFRESKLWTVTEATPEPEPVTEPEPPPPPVKTRLMSVAELIRGAERDGIESLAEMVVMQREVIERLSNK